MDLQQIDVTGSRLVGAMNKDLGHVGPKHHAIILGKNTIDGMVYIAENMDVGYQVVTYSDFCTRYAPNGDIKVLPNEGEFDNVTVANRAISEFNKGGKGIYNLVTNNCESFANRAMKNHSVSDQVVTTLGVLALIAASVYVVAQSRK